MTLPDVDRMEYISADSSGYELDKIGAFLTGQAARDPRNMDIIGLISNCHGLELYVLGERNLNLECPLLNWQGIGRDALTAFVNQRAAATDRDVWIVTENIPYAGLDGVTARRNKIITFDRPDGLSHLSIYHVVQSSEIF